MVHANQIEGLIACAKMRTLSPIDKKMIETTYREILGKVMTNTNCPDKYLDALCEIRLGYKMENKKYSLKNGVLLTFNGERYTNVNLTDDVAKAYLAEFPGAISKFSRFPETQEEQAVHEPTQEEQAVIDSLIQHMEAGETVDVLKQKRMSFRMGAKPIPPTKYNYLVDFAYGKYKNG